MKHLFGNDPVKVVMLGGASLLIAALLVVRVKDVSAETDQPQQLPEQSNRTAVPAA